MNPSRPAPRLRPEFLVGLPFPQLYGDELEQEQTELTGGIVTELRWNRIACPTREARVWDQLWAPLQVAPLRTQPCIYIIANTTTGEVVKVGKSERVESVKDRAISAVGPHATLKYRDLVVGYGFTLFWTLAPERWLKDLEVLIARIFLRVTTLTGHSFPCAVITCVNGTIDISEVLPPELADYAVRSFAGQGEVAVSRSMRGRDTSGDPTRYVQYPLHGTRDALDRGRRIKLAVARDHAF